MSALHTYQTEMTDPELIATAIESATADRAGGPLKATIHPEGIPLEGRDTYYWKETAHVVVHREQFGGWHNVGFQRQEDGTYRLLMSDMDLNKGWQQTDVHRIAQHYTAETLLRRLRGDGYVEFEREEVKSEEGVRIRLRAKTPQHLAPRQNVTAGAVRRLV